MNKDTPNGQAGRGLGAAPGSASRINVGMIGTTIGVLAMCVAIGLSNVGNGVMAFGIYLLGISTGVTLATPPNLPLTHGGPANE